MKRSSENIIGVVCGAIYFAVTAAVAIAAWRDQQAERAAFSKPGMFKISVEPAPGQYKRKHRF